MKRLWLFLLLAIGMMTATAPTLSAQDNIDLRSKENGKIYSYSLERVVDIAQNGYPIIEGQFADLVTDFYNTVFRSRGAKELAVQFLESRTSKEILAIQWTPEGKIHSLRMWTPEFGWMNATKNAIQKVTNAID